ncbi:MAG: hypothetical protein V5A72_01835 [Candidatus Nanohaloarchaea archaeon]
MVDISDIQTTDEQVATTQTKVEHNYDEADFKAFGEFWERTSKELEERVENHEFESSSFQSDIPGKRKKEGYKSQVNRDFGDTLEMLPDRFMSDADGRFANTVEAVAQGNLIPEVAADEDELSMEYVDTAAEKP